MVRRSSLVRSILACVGVYQGTLYRIVSACSLGSFRARGGAVTRGQRRLRATVGRQGDRLGILLARGMGSLTITTKGRSLVGRACSSVRGSLFTRVRNLRVRVGRLGRATVRAPSMGSGLGGTLRIMSGVVTKNGLSQESVRLLVRGVMISRSKVPRVALGCNLSGLVDCDPTSRVGQERGAVVTVIVGLVTRSRHKFASTGCLSRRVASLKFGGAGRDVLPCVRLVGGLKVLRSASGPLGPCRVMGSGRGVVRLAGSCLPSLSTRAATGRVSSSCLRDEDSNE